MIKIILKTATPIVGHDKCIIIVDLELTSNDLKENFTMADHHLK
jgi:hypothetical protein